MASTKKKAAVSAPVRKAPPAKAPPAKVAPAKVAPAKVAPAKVAPAKVVVVAKKDGVPKKDGAKPGKSSALLTAKGIPVKDKAWGKKELAHFEARLMEERTRAMRQITQLDESMRSTIQNADGDLSAYSFHMADQGTDAMEREKAFLFASKEGRYLWHINQALRRLYKSPELFGICEMTGVRIEYERLDALPHARLSYKAKREEEGDGEVE